MFNRKSGNLTRSPLLGVPGNNFDFSEMNQREGKKSFITIVCGPE